MKSSPNFSVLIAKKLPFWYPYHFGIARASNNNTAATIMTSATIHLIQERLIAVKTILWANMMRLLDRGLSTHQLELASETLLASSTAFEREAREQAERHQTPIQRCCGRGRWVWWLVPCVPVGKWAWRRVVDGTRPCREATHCCWMG